MDKLEEILALIDTWSPEECIQFLIKNADEDTHSNKSALWSLRERCKHVASIEFSERIPTPK